LYGIQQSEKTLSDSTTSAQEQALHLSWLIHLIGDVHQPLHCCSLFNSDYPTGDKGGNSFFIKPATKGIPLHSFWVHQEGSRHHSQDRDDHDASGECHLPEDGQEIAGF
jgi:hypothetical protein